MVIFCWVLYFSRVSLKYHLIRETLSDVNVAAQVSYFESNVVAMSLLLICPDERFTGLVQHI